MKHYLITLLFLFPLGLEAQKTIIVDTDSMEVGRLVKAQILCLWQKDVEGFISFYAPDYIDMGGGLNGDGTIDFEKFRKKIEGYCHSDKFVEISKMPITEVFDFEHQEILTFKEVQKKYGLVEKFSFSLLEGDYLFRIPTKKSTLDSWFGIFRKLDTGWKIVAGD